MGTNDSAAGIALFDALVERGFMSEFDGLFSFWEIGVSDAPMATLRHVAAQLPLRDAVVSIWHSQRIAEVAYRRANATDVLAFLMNEQILRYKRRDAQVFEPGGHSLLLSPLGFSSVSFVNYTETPLHIARRRIGLRIYSGY